MKISFNKESLLPSSSNAQIENKTPQFQKDQLLFGGGDGDSWIDYFLEKIEDFFTSVINFFSQLFQDDFISSDDEIQKDIIITKIDQSNKKDVVSEIEHSEVLNDSDLKIEKDITKDKSNEEVENKKEEIVPIENKYIASGIPHLDKSSWAINESKISLIASRVNLPIECKKIKIDEIANTLSFGLELTEAENFKWRIEGRQYESSELMNNLQAITYKFKDLPDDEKVGITVRLSDAFSVCSPTAIRVSKTICDELYLGTKNSGVNDVLLQLIEEFKSDLLNKIYQKLGKDEYFHWNIQDRVRNEYGLVLGLDQSISKNSAVTYRLSAAAGGFAEKIRDEFLRVYKTNENAQNLVSHIRQRIIHQKIDLFDELVKIIELKEKIGNLDAKKYVRDNLFESEDLMVFKIKEEAVYLLLQSIEIVK